MTESEFEIVEGWLREAMEYGEERHNEPYEKAIQALEEVQAYRAIGTIEEFKALKEWKADIIESFCKYDVNSVEELMQEFKALKEKAEPKKPVDGGEALREVCPTCGRFISVMNSPYYCPCGQRLDWEWKEQR